MAWHSPCAKANHRIFQLIDNRGTVEVSTFKGADNCHIWGLFIKNFGGSGSGVLIANGASYNTVGGAGIKHRNVISGNGTGVSLSGDGTRENQVCGNYIGTEYGGIVGLGNGGNGVSINCGARSNRIGGTTEGERNIISGNYHGLTISNGRDNVVIGNYVGTDVNVSKDKAVYWDGRNEFGERVGSGVYFYNIQAEGFHSVKKMVILK